MAKTRPMTNVEWLNLTAQALTLCDKHGVLMDQVCGSGKTKTIVKARVAVAVMLRANGLSYPMIGRFVKKDHSTIVHEVCRARAAGLTCPNVVQSGSDETIGPREEPKGSSCDGETQRNDEVGDGATGGSTDPRRRQGGLGGAVQQRPAQDDCYPRLPSGAELYGSKEPGSTTPGSS